MKEQLQAALQKIVIQVAATDVKGQWLYYDGAPTREEAEVKLAKAKAIDNKQQFSPRGIFRIIEGT